MAGGATYQVSETVEELKQQWLGEGRAVIDVTVVRTAGGGDCAPTPYVLNPFWIEALRRW